MVSKTKSIVYLLLVLAVTATSTWHVLGKIALTEGMDASVFLVYRLLLTSCVLFAFMKLVLHIELVYPIPSNLHLRFGLVGVATFAHSALFLYGLMLTTPFLCAVMQPSVPVIVWLLSLILGVEKSNFRKAFGVVLCSLGAVGAAAIQAHTTVNSESKSTASLQDNTSAVVPSPVTHQQFFIGTVLIVLQCIFYSIHLVFQQPLVQRIPPIQVTATLYLVAGVCMFSVTAMRTVLGMIASVMTPPGVSTEDNTQNTSMYNSLPYWGLSHHASAFGALAFCVIFASAFTHGVYSWASRKVKPTTVSVFTTIEPVTTTLISMIATKSSLPSFPEFACAGIVALGVLLVVKGGGANVHANEDNEEEQLEMNIIGKLQYEPVGQDDLQSRTDSTP